MSDASPSASPGAERSLLGVPRSHLLQLAVLYLLAHGGVLFVLDAVYWDDWTLWNRPAAVVLDSYRQSGAMFNFFGHLHVLLLQAGPWLYHLALLALWFGSGVLLYRILQRQAWLRPADRLWLCALFLATPFFAARVAMINFPYTFSAFFFFLGWFFIGRSRVAAIACFLVSFHTQSLLVFYLLPMLDLFTRGGFLRRARDIAGWAVRHLDYLAAPFAWFAVKRTWFKPYGAYEGYNEQFALANLPLAVKDQFINLLALALHAGFVVAGFVVAFWLVHRTWRASTEPHAPQPALRWVLLGVLALVAGVFPYWILGHVTTFNDWHSRHQLLMPLGVALLVYAVAVRQQAGGRRVVLALALGFSLALNWQNYVLYFLDWNKQQALVAFMRTSPEVRAARLVVVNDQSPNVFGRFYRFYEINGMLRLALPDSPGRFGVHVSELAGYHAGNADRYFAANWNAEHHRREPGAPTAEITITGVYPPVIAATLR